MWIKKHINKTRKFQKNQPPALLAFANKNIELNQALKLVDWSPEYIRTETSFFNFCGEVRFCGEFEQFKEVFQLLALKF